MGITKNHLKRLGFKNHNKLFKESTDSTTLSYTTKNNYIFSLPRNKTVIFYGCNFDKLTGVAEMHPFIYLDNVGYFRLRKILNDIEKINFTEDPAIWIS